MQEQTLQDQIDKILSQPIITDDDIIELSKLNYKQSRLFNEYTNLWAKVEEQYNLKRWEYFVEIKKKYKEDWRRITDSEADRYAKDRSEREFGYYRTAKAKGKGIWWEIAALNTIIIACMWAQKRSITGDYNHDTQLTNILSDIFNDDDQ